MKNFFKTEFGKLRQMSFNEGRLYLWEYYKLHFFAFIIGGFMVGSLLNSLIFNPPKTDYLYMAVLGIHTTFEQLDQLTGSLNEIVEDPDRQRVSAFNYSWTDDPQMNMATQTRLMAMLQQGEIDVFLTTDYGALELAEEGLAANVNAVMYVLARLNPELHNEILAHLQPTTFQIGDTWRTEIIKIPLRDSPLFRSLGANWHDAYLSIVVNATQFDAIARAIEVMFR